MTEIQYAYIKDVKPSQKNLNVIFIVLEVGKLKKKPEKTQVAFYYCIHKRAFIYFTLSLYTWQIMLQSGCTFVDSKGSYKHMNILYTILTTK